MKRPLQFIGLVLGIVFLLSAPVFTVILIFGDEMVYVRYRWADNGKVCWHVRTNGESAPRFCSLAFWKSVSDRAYFLQVPHELENDSAPSFDEFDEYQEAYSKVTDGWRVGRWTVKQVKVNRAVFRRYDLRESSGEPSTPVFWTTNLAPNTMQLGSFVPERRAKLWIGEVPTPRGYAQMSEPPPLPRLARLREIVLPEGFEHESLFFRKAGHEIVGQSVLGTPGTWKLSSHAVPQSPFSDETYLLRFNLPTWAAPEGPDPTDIARAIKEDHRLPWEKMETFVSKLRGQVVSPDGVPLSSSVKITYRKPGSSNKSTYDLSGDLETVVVRANANGHFEVNLSEPFFWRKSEQRKPLNFTVETEVGAVASGSGVYDGAKTVSVTLVPRKPDAEFSFMDPVGILDRNWSRNGSFEWESHRRNRLKLTALNSGSWIDLGEAGRFLVEPGANQHAIPEGLGGWRLGRFHETMSSCLVEVKNNNTPMAGVSVEIHQAEHSRAEAVFGATDENGLIDFGDLPIYQRRFLVKAWTDDSLNFRVACPDEDLRRMRWFPPRLVDSLKMFRVDGITLEPLSPLWLRSTVLVGDGIDPWAIRVEGLTQPVPPRWENPPRPEVIDQKAVIERAPGRLDSVSGPYLYRTKLDIAFVLDEPRGDVAGERRVDFPMSVRWGPNSVHQIEVDFDPPWRRTSPIPVRVQNADGSIALEAETGVVDDQMRQVDADGRSLAQVHVDADNVHHVEIRERLSHLPEFVPFEDPMAKHVEVTLSPIQGLDGWVRALPSTRMPFFFMLSRVDGLGDEVAVPIDAKSRFRLRLPPGRYQLVGSAHLGMYFDLEESLPDYVPFEFEVPHEGRLEIEVKEEE